MKELMWIHNPLQGHSVFLLVNPLVATAHNNSKYNYVYYIYTMITSEKSKTYMNTVSR